MPGYSDSPTDTTCPRCRFSDTLPHHVTRSATVYLCRDCEHEWEVFRADVAPGPSPALTPPAPSST
jgi:transposase-like protein